MHTSGRATHRVRNARWCTRQSCSRTSRAIVRRVFTCTRHGRSPLSSANSRGLPLQASVRPLVRLDSPGRSFGVVLLCISQHNEETANAHRDILYITICRSYFYRTWPRAWRLVMTTDDAVGARWRSSWEWSTACVQTRHTYTRRLTDRRLLIPLRIVSPLGRRQKFIAKLFLQIDKY